MARIRSVHPGLFTDEAFVSLSETAQIFLVGLWTEADDQGIFEWKTTTLRMRLRPTKDGDVEPILSELRAANSIKSYELSGRKYGAVRNFRRFQRPKKPNAIHPMSDEIRTYVGLGAASGEIDEALGGDSSEPDQPEHGVSSELFPQMEDEGGRREDVVGEEKKEKNKKDRAKRAPDNHAGNGKSTEPYVFKHGVIGLVKADFDQWKQAFPNISLESELIAISSWAQKLNGGWFVPVSNALAKKQREALLAIERIKIENSETEKSKPLWDPGT